MSLVSSESTFLESLPTSQMEDPSVSSTALNTFAPFPRLPPELRLQIWEYTAQQPRNLDLWASRIPPSSPSKQDVYPSFQYSTLSPIPGILHASREARYTGLLFYSLGFSQSFQDENGDEVLELKRPGVWVNWDVDRLVLMDLWRWEGAALGGVFGEKRMRHLACNAEVGDWRCAWFLGLRLETLTLYHFERSFRLAKILNFQVKGQFEIGFEDLAESVIDDADRGGVEGREMEALRRAKDKVIWEFEELEDLQERWDESFERGEYTTVSVLGSPVFGDAFARSAGWLRGEDEVSVKRKRPEIGFARVRMGCRQE